MLLQDREETLHATESLPRSPQASVACTHLEDALSLLQGPGQGPANSIAPHLVSEIKGSLRSLRVPSIQEELMGSVVTGVLVFGAGSRVRELAPLLTR